MSGMLKKTPSEGDIHKKVSEALAEEQDHPTHKKEALRKTRSLITIDPQKKRFGTADYKRITGNRGGVRLVWRASTTTDLDSLNKVLGLSQATKRARSPSPLPLTPRADSVFSEFYDPLSVQKRVITDSDIQTESEDIDLNSSSRRSSLGRRETTKRQDISYINLEMPSVKSLKSIFENIGKGSSKNDNVSHPAKRSATFSMYGRSKLQESGTKEKIIHQSIDNKPTVIESKGPAIRDNEKQKLEENKVIRVTQSSDLKSSESVKKEIAHDESRRSKLQKNADIESDHLPTIKNLLSIFERPQMTRSNILDKKQATKKIEESRVTEIPETITVAKTYEASKGSIADGLKATPKVPEKTEKESPKMVDDKPKQKVVHEEKIQTTSESVFSLRKKWESLTTLSTTNQTTTKAGNSKSEVSGRRLSGKRSVSHESIELNANAKELKIETAKVVISNITETLSHEIKVPEVKPTKNVENALNLEKKATSEYLQNDKVTRPASIQRGDISRSSVKDMALLYEKKKAVRTHSAPPTPSIPKKEITRHKRNVTTDDLNYSDNSSKGRLLTSMSIDSIKNELADERKHHENTREIESNTTLSAYNPQLLYKEMSLGSLERKASVKNMKKKFELSEQASSDHIVQRQNSAIKISRKEENSNQSIKRQNSATNVSAREENSSQAIKRQSSITSTSVKEILTFNEINTDTKYIRSKYEKSLLAEVQPTKDKTITHDTKINRNESSKVKNNSYHESVKPVALKKTINEIESTNHVTENRNQGVEKTALRTTNKINSPTKTSKIEDLVKDFVKSEGLSTYLETLDEVSSSSPESIRAHPVSYPPKQKTDDYLENHIEIFPNKSSQEPSNASENLKDISLISKMAPKLSSGMRSGSRELKPDELKYFKSLTAFSESTEKPKKKDKIRERSSSIDSSSPTSTLPKDDFAKSKLRSSYRPCRDLHTDELKFFGLNGSTTTAKLSRTSSEVALRQETLEKALRAATLEEEVARKE